MLKSASRFMESELELHEEIQKLHVLATVPEYYEIFVKFNAAATCLGLLNHENTGTIETVTSLCTNFDLEKNLEELKIFCLKSLY